MTIKEASPRDLLKNLSTQDFLNLGMRDVAYIRPVSIENKTAYAIHAADGTPLKVMDTLAAAAVMVRENDLEPVTVH